MTNFARVAILAALSCLPILTPAARAADIIGNPFSGAIVVPEAQLGGMQRFPRIDPRRVADTKIDEKKAFRDLLAGGGNIEKKPTPAGGLREKNPDFQKLIDDYAPVYDEMRDILARMFASADRHIAALNAAIAEAEIASLSCDRARYDTAIDRLISAYVKTSLHLQYQMDEIDALATAGAEMDDSVYESAKRRWSLFWASAHDMMSSGNAHITEAMKIISERNSISYRAFELGRAFSEVYDDILKRIETIIETADYPRFRPCDDVEAAGNPLPEPDERAEIAAQEKALAEMEKELDETRKQFEKIAEGIDGLADALDGDATIPGDGVEATSPTGDGAIAGDPDAAVNGAPVAVPDAVVALPGPPGLPPIPQPPIFTSPLAGVVPAGPASRPVADLRSDPCGLDAEKVCSVLLGQFREDCRRELDGFLAICKQAPAIVNCENRCDANWQQGLHNQALAKLAQDHIRAVAATFDRDSDGNLEGIEAEIEATKKRIADIRADAERRVYHVYINENTDAIIRHRGKPIRAQPPLRYAGTTGGALSLAERLQIRDLEARTQALEKEIESLAGAVLDKNDWIATALAKWEPDPNVADGKCTADQNDANRASCLAECRGAVTAGVLHVCYASYVPQLALPYGRAYLYPPGHPESDPARGLK